MELVTGKRYEWTIYNYGGKSMTGLFTGKYDEQGSAILLTKWGDEWHVPIKCVRTCRKGKR